MLSTAVIEAAVSLDKFACRQELAAAIATDGLLPLMRNDTPAPLAALLKACWSLDPADRPSAQQMLQELQHLLS